MAAKEKKACWLFVLVVYGRKTNYYFDHFPTRDELVSASKSRNYCIVNVIKLTEEQYNALKPEEEQ